MSRRACALGRQRLPRPMRRDDDAGAELDVVAAARRSIGSSTRSHRRGPRSTRAPQAGSASRRPPPRRRRARCRDARGRSPGPSDARPRRAAASRRSSRRRASGRRDAARRRRAPRSAAPMPSASSSARLLAAMHSPQTLRRGNACRSISATDQPARASRIAAAAPAGPAPTMATSNRVVMTASSAARRPGSA